MEHTPRNFVVVGRLRRWPVLAFVAFSLALTAFAIWQTGWGDGFVGSMFYRLFGKHSVLS